MPLTIKEVLETLEDPVALGIDFYADKIHVKGEDLSRVHERILVGDILVTGGVKDLAFYDSATDVLLTQKKDPPADDDDRALLLHECVHAMIDIVDPKPPSHGTWANSRPISPRRRTAFASIRQPTEPGRRRGTTSGAISSRRCERTNWIARRATAQEYRMRHSKACVTARRPAVCRLWKLQQGGERRFERAVPPLFIRELGRWPVHAVLLLRPRNFTGSERRLSDRYAQGELFACRCEGLRGRLSQAAPRFPLLLQASRLHVEKSAFGADTR